jgi:hypothetical protein
MNLKTFAIHHSVFDCGDCWASSCAHNNTLFAASLSNEKASIKLLAIQMT